MVASSKEKTILLQINGSTITGKSKKASDPFCTLCSQSAEPYLIDEKRSWEYFHCSNCDLVFRDPATYLGENSEKQRYATHNNSIENQGYVKFLTPAVELMGSYLEEKALGLDFGCGPGPILDILFAKKNILVKNYDPYFFKDESLLSQCYDFVTCTEVIEHLYQPSEIFPRLWELLKPQGHLLLMTDPRPKKEKFIGWGYRMDNTHVCFYSEKTIHWLAQNFSFKVIELQGRLSLLQKV